MRIYNIDEKRWLNDEFDRLTDGDHLSIDIKYVKRISLKNVFGSFLSKENFLLDFSAHDTTNLIELPRFRPENCSIKMNFAENENQTRRIRLLIDGCPSMKAKNEFFFRRLTDGDDDHFISSVLTMKPIVQYSFITFECSIRYCENGCEKVRISFLFLTTNEFLQVFFSKDFLSSKQQIELLVEWRTISNFTKRISCRTKTFVRHVRFSIRFVEETVVFRMMSSCPNGRENVKISNYFELEFLCLFC